LVVAPASYAEGAASIAAAPTVVPGQQEFGSLSTYFEPPNYPENFVSWWLLPLTAGDSVQVLWEGRAEDYVRLFPPNTTDYNQSHATRLINTFLQGGYTKNEAKYEATETGAFPLQFIHNVQGGKTGFGPYNFTVYVTHALNVALPHVAVLHRSGTLTVPVHSPEGGPISNPAVQVEVQIKGHGSWQTIGVAAVANSAAVIQFKVPTRLRHQHVTLRALAHGTGYSPASSSHLKVRTL
jgi:hypothetical protein